MTCHYFHLATEVADRLTAKQPHVKTDVSGYIKEQWYGRLKELQDVGKRDMCMIYQHLRPCSRNLIPGTGPRLLFTKDVNQVNKSS